MVQQLRPEEPKYSCVIPIHSLTGHQDEEIITFGGSPAEAKNQAEQLLVDKYGCHKSSVHKLLQQAKVEPLSYWCSPNEKG